MIREVRVDGRRRSYILTQKGEETLAREVKRLRARVAHYDVLFNGEGAR